MVCRVAFGCAIVQYEGTWHCTFTIFHLFEGARKVHYSSFSFLCSFVLSDCWTFGGRPPLLGTVINNSRDGKQMVSLACLWGFKGRVGKCRECPQSVPPARPGKVFPRFPDLADLEVSRPRAVRAVRLEKLRHGGIRWDSVGEGWTYWRRTVRGAMYWHRWFVLADSSTNSLRTRPSYA